MLVLRNRDGKTAEQLAGERGCVQIAQKLAAERTRVLSAHHGQENGPQGGWVSPQSSTLSRSRSLERDLPHTSVARAGATDGGQRMQKQVHRMANANAARKNFLSVVGVYRK